MATAQMWERILLAVVKKVLKEKGVK